MSIRDALEAGDLDKIRILVQTVGKDELKSALISQNITTNNGIDHQGGSERVFEKIMRSNAEFAYKILFLFSPTERKQIYPDFSWHYFFTYVERKNTTSDNKLKCKPSARQLADKIRRIFPEINAAELNCNSLSLKHYRAALFLGMPFREEFFLDVLSYKEYSSYLLKELLIWLIRYKFITKNPFPLKDIPHQLIHGNKFIVNIILKEFPQSLTEIDEYGNSIFYYFSHMNPKSVLRLLDKIRKILLPQQIVELLAHQCQNNVLPAISLGRKLKNTFVTVPIEIVRAYALIVKRNDVRDIATISRHLHEFHHTDMSTALLLHLYLGIGSKDGLDRFKDILPPMKIDAKTGEYLFDTSAGARDKKKNSARTPDPTPHPDQPAYIFNLPEEMLLLIAFYLPPFDALNYLLSCKHLSQCLKSAHNELIWQSYHKRHFYPCNLMGSFKKKFLVETRGAMNWRENKSHKLTVPDIAPSCHPHLMDENWLLLVDNYSAARFWNCHSQRIEFAYKKLDFIWRPQAMLNCYSHNETPPVIIAEGSYKPSSYKLMRREKAIDLPKLSEVYQARPPAATYRDFAITPIDHRVVLSDHSTLYDVAQDRVLRQLPEPIPLPYRGPVHAYNPYNRTLLRISDSTVNIYDLDYKLVQSIATSPTGASVLQMVDEFTFLLMLSTYYNETMFYDTRMNNQPLLKIADIFGRTEITSNKIVKSPHRLVYQSYKVPLEASFNLVTREMEWVECSEMVPKCINSRYLVSMNNGHIDIRDYCNNQIRYE